MNINQIFEQAAKEHQDGRLEEAERLYNSILEVQPDHLEANNNLGIILKNDGRLDEAEARFKRAINIKPDFAEAYNNLGNTISKLNKIDEALICYKKAIEIKPDYNQAHYNLGTTLHTLEIIDEAEASFKKAIELKPDYMKAHFNLGVIQSRQDRHKEAEISFRKTIELKPDHAEAHNNLGNLLYSLNKFDEAEISYRKAIEIKPDFAQAHESLKFILDENKFLLILSQTRNSEKKTKLNNLNFSSRLTLNPFISHRTVEEELVNNIYTINSKSLNQTKNIFFGNGRHSNNFRLFENDYPILRNVEEDLVCIMEQAVKSKVFVRASFFHILNAGAGSVPHTHISSFDKANDLINQKYSLQYYLSVGDQNCDEPGIFKMHNPNEEFLPSKGMITIIPASRKHSAAYGGKTDRVMIGVNFYSLI